MESLIPGYARPKPTPIFSAKEILSFISVELNLIGKGYPYLSFCNGTGSCLGQDALARRPSPKRKKRTKGEQNFVFGHSPVVMFNLECNL